MHIQSRKCSMKDCGRRASYGVDGGLGIRCALHHEEGDINLAVKRCAEKDCGKAAAFCSGVLLLQSLSLTLSCVISRSIDVRREIAAKQRLSAAV